MINAIVSQKTIKTSLQKDIIAELPYNSIDTDENVKVVKGDTGAVYTPYVDKACNLSWTNNGNLPNPPPVNIKGDTGDATVTPISNIELEAIMGGL